MSSIPALFCSARPVITSAGCPQICACVPGEVHLWLHRYLSHAAFVLQTQECPDLTGRRWRAVWTQHQPFSSRPLHDSLQDMTEEPLRELMTVEQAANYLHVSTSSIRSYIRQGKLKAFRVAGIRQVRIPRSELLKLLEPTNSQISASANDGSTE